MKVGYARVSSNSQNLDRQIAALQGSHVKKIFQEKISGKNTERPELQKMLAFIREDDEVVVLSLDRLGRNSNDISNIIQEIRKKGAVLHVLNFPSFEGIKDPNLKALLTNMILEVEKFSAQQERERIHERQREGIQLAKERGAYKGRPTEYSATSTDPQKRLIYKEIVRLLAQKEAGKKITITDIARQTNVSRYTVYKIKERAKERK